MTHVVGFQPVCTGKKGQDMVAVTTKGWFGHTRTKIVTADKAAKLVNKDRHFDPNTAINSGQPDKDTVSFTTNHYHPSKAE